MNIIEAIKSGKRFKRKNEDQWYQYLDLHSSGIHGMDRVLYPTGFDIVADDWEIEEEKRELSWGQIKEAYIIAINMTSDGSKQREIIKTCLGFKDE